MTSVRERRFENLLADTENSASLQKRKALAEERKGVFIQQKQATTRQTPHNEKPLHQLHATGYDASKRATGVNNNTHLPAGTQGMENTPAESSSITSSQARVRKKVVKFQPNAHDEKLDQHDTAPSAAISAWETTATEEEQQEETENTTGIEALVTASVGEDSPVVVVDSTPLQRTLEELAGTNADQETEGSSLADRIDDALDPGCKDLGMIQALLMEVQESGFHHASVTSLEIKCGTMEEAVAAAEAEKELKARIESVKVETARAAAEKEKQERAAAAAAAAAAATAAAAAAEAEAQSESESESVVEAEADIDGGDEEDTDDEDLFADLVSD